jgi:O-antigen/teichoic acid export membrane protein
MAAAVVGLALVVLREPLAGFLDVPPGFAMGLLIAGPAIALRQSWLASLRARGMARMYAASQVLEPLLDALLIGVLLWTSVNLAYDGVAAAYTTGVTVVAATAVLAWRLTPGFRVSARTAIILLSFSWPLILHALANYALNTYDQVIINQLLGVSSAGAYAFAYRFGMAMVILSAAFSALWMPTYLDRIRSPEAHAQLRHLAQRSFSLIALGAVVLMLALPVIALLVGGAAYRANLGLIPIIVYGYLWFVLYTFVVGHSMHEKRTRRIAVATLIAGGLNIALNYVAIPLLGITGAAAATVVSYSALFGLQLAMAPQAATVLGLGRLAAATACLAPIALAVFVFWS